MPHFRCTIVTSAGKRITAVKEAANTVDLAASFNDSGHILAAFKQIPESAMIQAKKNFKHGVILEFTEIMASLLKSGLTVQDAVSLCAFIAADGKTVWLSRSILSALQRGLPLHEALGMHAPSFSSLYRSMVRLGEQAGSVTAVFARMSEYLRNEKKIRGKIENVIWYPLLVLCAALAGSAAIIAFVLPRMAEIFAAFTAGAESGAVPELERMYRSVWASLIIFLVIAAAVIIVVLLRRYSARFAYLLDYLILKLPLFGAYAKAVQTMDFSFAMEMLTGQGINVHTALHETSSVVRNRAYGKALTAVHSMLVKGEQLSRAFSLFGEFPPYVSTWIAVGERTGTVRPIFTQIREYFQEDVDRMSARLMNLLEPGLILLVGIIVLGMVLQFIAPLFSLYGRLL